MQNMERYFGFRVYINNDLDPEDEKSLRSKALEIVDVDAIDLSQYHVYLHQLIIRSNETHFNISGGLSKRVQKLNIEFHINEKQRRNNDIRFMNYKFKTGTPVEVKPYFQPSWIGYDIPVSYFEKTSWFQNAIIAFVKKDLREHHKKIKVIVTTEPTPEFERALHSHNINDSSTHLDLRFSGSVQLRLPIEHVAIKPSGDSVPMTTYNNFGTVGSFGPNATASDFSQNQQLLVQLEELSRVAKRDGKVSVAADIDSALDAIKEKKNLKALDYLKKLGDWALPKAEKLAMGAAAEAIKVAIGS